MISCWILMVKERKTTKVYLEKTSLDFIRGDSFLNIALKLCYKSGTQLPLPQGFLGPPRIPFFFPFSSILYYLSFIYTVHVQIQIGSANTCPINPSLKPSGVVVKAFNVILATSSQIFPCLPLSCSFLILILFHGTVRSVALNGRPYPLSSALPSRGGVLPWTTLGVALIRYHFFTY